MPCLKSYRILSRIQEPWKLGYAGLVLNLFPERPQYDTRSARYIAQRPLQLISPDEQCAQASNFPEERTNVDRVKVTVLNPAELFFG